jgi:hypothetical protein
MVPAAASPILPPSEAAATGMSSHATNPVDPRVREAELNHRLVLDRDGRQFVPVAGSRHLDVEAALPAAVKSRMQEPIRAVRHVITLPVFDPVQLESFA